MTLKVCSNSSAPIMLEGLAACTIADVADVAGKGTLQPR